MPGGHAGTFQPRDKEGDARQRPLRLVTKGDRYLCFFMNLSPTFANVDVASVKY